jgi:hypothetical protein
MKLLPGGSKICSLFSATASRPALVPTHTSIQGVPGAFIPGVKRLGREGDHSPQSSAEVKNMWSYTSTPQYVLMVRGLVTLYFTIVLIECRVKVIAEVSTKYVKTLRKYEGVFKSFRTGRLERELQMVQLSATRYSCIAIL